MRTSLPLVWCAATGLACLLIEPATGFDLGTLGDEHLNVVPRTAEETARIGAVTTPTTDFTTAEPFEERPAGAATVRARSNADAFSQPSANIGFEGELEFKVGNGLFRKIWVTAPASTEASDGLGPLYNARGCQNCHIKDGRGHLPEGPDDNAVSFFLRVSIPAETALKLQEIEDYIGATEEPNYGGQIQDFATGGIPAEAQLSVSYEERPVELSGGETVMLRDPTYALSDLGFGPLHPDAMLSPRLTPQMIGLGLLEAIPAQDILALADEDDADGDGISGRPNLVWSREFDKIMLGRFGLKAGTPTIKHQSAAAFSGDIGISNPLFPNPWGECTEAQTACVDAEHGDDGSHDGFEVDETGLDLVTFYARNLAVPARRRADDPEVLRGKKVFYSAGCASCHTPKFVTHRLDDQPAQSFQLIWPYTDMLLHDMGEGLADNRPEGRANGREWRTAPLWGIGLTELVSGDAAYLHDGRARTLMEAILWHGGEAQTARDHVVDLPKPDRDALVKFLESL
ncbi:di-heme oxidoredictase family protein [Maritimibacter sp. UBA3975]|uniref:di-heme oxidoreductase family protein n=1 Tax=Maritimibacter sp. UBA3975 TaxID=1946833 RepID=UPI000C0AC3A0|nr:di-heme oxidoredictase family protein [Maritimibacter sp. UBA3975]MAM63517.1 thiol oxidoreductase [Maritimibacter sp.]|tara:strand:+ start:90725 stop:92269 length:1545 start_codon:yes stop_codon:yes gene_type:complete